MYEMANQEKDFFCYPGYLTHSWNLFYTKIRLASKLIISLHVINAYYLFQMLGG